MHWKSLTADQRKKVLESHIFVERKRDGILKALGEIKKDLVVNCLNLLHLLQVGEGAIHRLNNPDWLQPLGLLHDMGTTMIVMSLTFLGGDNDVGHAATTDKINTTAMLILGTILSDYDGDPIGRRIQVNNRFSD